MADVIRADYAQLQQIAERFTKRAETMSSMTTSVRGSYSPLKEGSWLGLGVEAFSREMEEKIFPALARLIDALTEAGRITGAVAQTLEEADAEASTPFEESRNEEQSEAGSGGGSGGGAGSGAGRSGDS